MKWIYDCIHSFIETEGNMESEYKRDVIDIFQANAEHPCKVQFPFPLEEPLVSVEPPSTIPKTFQWKVDYQKKLKECPCNAVYPQFKRQMISESISQKKTNTIHPKFLLPAVNTNISFMQHVNRYKISPSDLRYRMSSSIPDYFNWSEQSSEITKPTSQGMCGSCYTIAVATCLSDMYVTSKQTPINPNLSATYLLSCYPQGNDSQCGGGDPTELIREVQKNGVSDSKCLDYSFCGPSTGCGGNPNIPFDPKQANQMIPPCLCQNQSKPNRKYYISEASSLCVPPNLEEFSEVDQTVIKGYLDHLYGGSDNADLSKLSYQEIQRLIKHHIYTHGPVIGGFHVFKNFFADRFTETNDIYIESHKYAGVLGVDYRNVEKTWEGSHAVVIVGWGSSMIENETVPYWIVRNSWSPFWGNAGYFKIAMYGNDPTKKYQNRISQFEYPSVLHTEQGIALTGGIIIITPGKIDMVPLALNFREIRQVYRKPIGVILLILLGIMYQKKVDVKWIVLTLVLGVLLLM